MSDQKDHFQEGKKHLQKGTEEILRHGIKQGKRQKEKLRYYQRNRSQLIHEVSENIGNPKKPAISGIIVLAPIAVTFYVLYWFYRKINLIPGTEIFSITVYPIVNDLITLTVGILALSIIITGIGRFARTKSGFILEKHFDRLIDRIPIIGTIYNITKVTTDTVLTGAEGFRKPVKMDMNGLRATGFRTGNKSEDGRDVIFFPTSPNVTSGFVLEVEDEKIIETDETVEDALTRILSAGFGESEKQEEQEE